MIIGLCLAFFIIIIDQLVKYWTLTQLDLYESLPGIPGVFDFFYIQNRGASWGILSGRMALFYLVTLVVVVYLLYLMYKTPNFQTLSHIAYGLLIGGALGNFIDRLLHGYVVDMFRLLFISFPIFNVADMSLTVGVVILVVLVFVNYEERNQLKHGK